jgi:two-component system, NtrC family, C4-dicarboxylate transport response regulator DctD
MRRVLVVDDEEHVRHSIGQWLEINGHQVELAADAPSALRAVRRVRPDAVISDIKMPHRSGIELMHELQALDASLPVILLTAHGEIPLAVSAIRDGAHDFLQKPYVPEHLLAVVARAIEQGELRLQLRRLTERVAAHEGLAARIVGASSAIERVREAVSELARIASDVVVVGETGTGKEVVARALHDIGPRASGPFVAVNCAALPAELFESELFGHEAGAFTGARGARAGKFEFASGGTLLLDEVESLPLPLQPKLLRVLQERSFERLGSNHTLPIDVRILAATKADLRAEADAGRFRSDLYYRLCGAQVTIPPLRAREGDVLLLFEHFCGRATAVTGSPVRPLDSDDVSALLAHVWPGNVRELKTVAERYALGLKALGRTVREILGAAPELDAPQTLGDRVAAFERQLIASALKECAGSMTQVVERLGIPRRTLNEKMVRYGLVRPERVGADPLIQRR